MIWDTLPESVRKHYRWESGELYFHKKCISNYYIKPLRYLNHSEGKTVILVQYVIGEEEETACGIMDLSSFEPLALSEASLLRCVEFSRSAQKDLLAFARLQLPGLLREGWYLDRIGWHCLSLSETSSLPAAPGQSPQRVWVYCAGKDVFPETLAGQCLTGPGLSDRFHIRHNPMGREKAVLEEVKELLDFGHPALWACLLYLVTGLLRSLFFSVNVPPRFLLYISGDTGTYKTTLASYFFDMYQEGQGISFASADLTSSEAAIQSLMGQFRDCVFILDDLSKGVHSQETIRKENSLNNLIRTAANCEERYVKSGSHIRGEMIQCQLAVTAEYSLELESIMNRTVLVDLNRMPVSQEILRFLADHSFLIHSFALLFVRWSARNTEEICRYIRGSWEGYRSSARDMEGSPRIQDSIYILAIACGILIDCFSGYQADTGGMDQMAWAALQRIREEEEKQLRNMRLEDGTCNMAREIVNLLHSKKTAVISPSSMKNRAADCWERNGYLYITPDSLLAALETVTKDEGLTKNKISAYLKKNHLLEMDKSKDSTVKWNGTRYYKINCAALEEAAGIEMNRIFKM